MSDRAAPSFMVLILGLLGLALAQRRRRRG